MKKALMLFFLLWMHFAAFAQHSLVDSLELRLKLHSSSDTSRVNLLNELASAVYNTDSERYYTLSKEACSLARELYFPEGKKTCLSNLAWSYWSQHAWDEALAIYKELLSLAEKTNDRHLTLLCFNNIGMTYYEQGQIATALEHFTLAVALAGELDDYDGLIMAYNYLGLANSDQGNYPGGLEFFNRALLLAASENDMESLAALYNNIGMIYYYQAAYEEALSYYRKALHYSGQISDTHGTATNLLNIGIVHSDMGDLHLALNFFEIVSDKLSSLDDKYLLSLYHNNLAEIYLETGDYDLAEEHFYKGLQYSIEGGSVSTEGWNYAGLGSLFMLQNEFAKAHSYNHKAYDLAVKTGEAELIRRTAEAIAQSAAKLNLFEQAYTFHVKFKNMSDSVLNIENTRKILTLEFDYKLDKEIELAKAEQDKKYALHLEEIKRHKAIRNFLIAGIIMILLLFGLVLYGFIQKRKMNRLLASQRIEIINKNAALTQLNSDKDRIMQILAHDLRSPFNALLGFTQLMLSSLKDYTAEEIEHYLRIMQDAQQQSFDLLNDLLLWSKSQAGKLPYEPVKINLSEVCDEIVNEKSFQAQQKKIVVEHRCEAPIYLKADNFMLKTILRNLISNAINFTHQNGKIVLHAEKNHARATIIVSDNGVGISDENKKKLWSFNGVGSSVGTNNEKGTGFGLTICKDMVEKHGGNIWVESKPGLGSDFKFTLPMYEQQN